MSSQNCEICLTAKAEHSDDSGEYCLPCLRKITVQSALDAGIPLSVIEGKTKLSDHFSKEYIAKQCGRGE